jgi:hypothetical protein
MPSEIFVSLLILHVRTVGVHTLILSSRATRPHFPRPAPQSRNSSPPSMEGRAAPAVRAINASSAVRSPAIPPRGSAAAADAPRPASLPWPHPARIPPASTLDASDEAAEGMGVRGEGEVGGADVRWRECRPFPATVTSAVQARIHTLVLPLSAVQARIHGVALPPPPILQSRPLQHRRRRPSHLPHRICGARFFTGYSGRPCPPPSVAPPLSPSPPSPSNIGPRS